jgi:hypothetical protein
MFAATSPEMVLGMGRVVDSESRSDATGEDVKDMGFTWWWLHE